MSTKAATLEFTGETNLVAPTQPQKKGCFTGSKKKVEQVNTKAAEGAKKGACCAKFVKNHSTAITVGIVTFLILAAIVGTGLGLGAHYLGGIDKIPDWLNNTHMTIAQGVEFIAAPIIGGAILIALTGLLAPKAVKAIKRKCDERKKADNQPENLTKKKQKTEEQKVKKGGGCVCGCAKKKATEGDGKGQGHLVLMPEEEQHEPQILEQQPPQQQQQQQPSQPEQYQKLVDTYLDSDDDDLVV